MRLIDADEFKKQIAGMAVINNFPAEKANKMCELIDCQPTVYDVGIRLCSGWNPNKPCGQREETMCKRKSSAI